jgi:LCP family protein required for cell wall assembly
MRLRWAGALALLGLVSLTAGVEVALAAQSPPGGPPVVQVHKVDEGHFVLRPDQPVFMLALGIDGRAGIDSDRADAIHLIGVNPGAGSAVIIDIPRDTYVPIPGHGRSKINDGFFYGGAALQAQVVEQLTGVHIGFVITTTFAGFPRMVDELGGITVTVPYVMKDRYSGANFDPGLRHMNGPEAFAFARDRHIADGDLNRTVNQGTLIIGALAKLRADGAGASPARVVKSLAVLGRHSRLNGVGVVDLYNLGRLALSIDPARVRNVGMPATLGKVGSLDVVFVAPAAGSLFADFRDDAALQAH